MEVGPYDVSFFGWVVIDSNRIDRVFSRPSRSWFGHMFFDLFSLKVERSHATCQFLDISAHELELFSTETWIQMTALLVRS